MAWYTNKDCDLEQFKILCAQKLSADDVPNAVLIEKNIPIYDAANLQDAFTEPAKRAQLMGEWCDILAQSAGVLVIKNAVPDTAALDDASTVFNEIIADEKELGSGADHFAASGANDRIWNSLEKLCLRAPEVFARCFAAPAIDALAQAWLGKAYQMTSQVNLVRPGGKAQTAHRDYHLGFMSADQAASYPKHVHDISPVLTLQGAVAHCDMPLESGPTKLLPFSQSFGAGYLAYRLENFAQFFEENYVQMPLEKGDALFFNPALFHAAGENVSQDINRMANLLQISSPMGRAMETVDRSAMAMALYPVLLGAEMEPLELDAVITASAEGYPFPTNLDTDPPKNGLAPQSQASLMQEFLQKGANAQEFSDALEKQNMRKI